MTGAITPNFIGGGDPYDPAIGIPARPIAGNTADDDGQALDQFFQAPDLGPQSYGIPDVNPDELPVTTRILSVSHDLVPDIPVMFLPADPNRIKLVLEVFSILNATIRIGSDANTCRNGASIFSAVTSNVVDLSGHTGPLWVINTGSVFYAKDSFVAVAITK